MKNDTSIKFTSSELVTLDKFLRNQARDMSLVKAHGFITAIVSFPDLFLPSEWIPILVGELKYFHDHTPVDIMLDRLVDLYKEIAGSLQSNNGFKFLLSAEQPELNLQNAPFQAIQEWCNGYCLALVWNETEWLYAKEDFITKACATFFMLTDLINTSSTAERATEWKKDKQILIKNLPDLVKALYIYWLNEKDQILALDVKRIRQDPCPCGSNKSYIHCCLLEATEAILH